MPVSEPMLLAGISTYNRDIKENFVWNFAGARGLFLLFAWY